MEKNKYIIKSIIMLTFSLVLFVYSCNNDEPGDDTTGPSREDIVFAVDSSGSVGLDNFDNVKEFIKTIINDSVLDDGYSYLSVINFSSTVSVYFENTSLTIANKSSLLNNLDSLPYLSEFTNTKEAINKAIDIFDTYSTADSTKYLILLTDGNPQCAEGDSSCSTDVCSLASSLLTRSIRTVIIGIGSVINLRHIDCLVDSAYEATDIIQIDDFTTASFNTVTIPW